MTTQTRQEKAIIGEYGFCVLREGQWDTADGRWYATPGEAKVAARQFLTTSGLPAAWVRRCFNGGHYRTVTILEQEAA